jgi:apolipoprotein D and lipocalin family protein
MLAACLTLVLAAGATMQAATQSTVRTVDDVDLERYMGLWYAVAHIPTTFERRCIRGITAEYTLLENGQVQVVNGCCQEDGSLQQARGRAWIPDPQEPGKLKVSFVRFLWWWLFPGDYWILDLGDAYEYAVVGHPKLTYGWILSRTPTLPGPTLREIIGRLEEQGYSFDAFELMPPGDCQEPR